MTRNSEKTFQAEGSSFRNIRDIFWGTETEYPVDPFAGILDGRPLNPEVPDELGLENPRGAHPLGGRGLFYTGGVDSLKQIESAASEVDFAEILWDSLGIDISDELKGFASSGRVSNRALQDLTATFGTDAFGTYCPWHAFGKSTETPWGIYLFFEKLIEWAIALHQANKFLPDPKPSILRVFHLLCLLTYRHEQFHYQVEVYATRLESALRRPIYRPYVERVRTPVSNTPQWLEEALAQAVVLKSGFVKRTLGVDSQYMKSYVVPYFRQFPEGYKRFECKSVSGGVDGAHRLLSAQIARGTIDIPESERNTNLSLAKSEYGTRRTSVPGYWLFTPQFLSRFQLQTPRLKDVERFIRRYGQVDEDAPGDHKKAVLNGKRFHLNRAKRGNTVDLASAKEMARILGIKVRDLSHAIA